MRRGSRVVSSTTQALVRRRVSFERIEGRMNLLINDLLFFFNHKFNVLSATIFNAYKNVKYTLILFYLFTSTFMKKHYFFVNRVSILMYVYALVVLLQQKL